MAKKKSGRKSVEALLHEGDKRRNIPTAEFQPVVREADRPVELRYKRNPDLDPQLVWRGKDQLDSTDLVVNAPPIYIQEKVHPKVLVEDLQRRTEAARREAPGAEADLFGAFNGLPEGADKTEFYQHDQNWTNRMILGDSLQVMASLAEREGLRGKVQCIYFDPPYGIEFNSNFQWSTTSRTVEDGNGRHITRQPEQVKAFRDTWRDGIHSYLSYLRDRLTVARDLLSESGSIFVQISDKNVHRVRAVMDDVFGHKNCVVTIIVQKKGNQKSSLIDPINDYLLWYSRTPRKDGQVKFRRLFSRRPLTIDEADGFRFSKDRGTSFVKAADFFALAPDQRLGYHATRNDPLTSGGDRANQSLPYTFQGVTFAPRRGNCWKTTARSQEGGCGMDRLAWADRLAVGGETFYYIRKFDDFAFKPISNLWTGMGGASDPVYVVQTNERLVERCILMATDPGDIVLDPTCGSGTTATVAEQWGRRWITIDTSRVALALARSRVMGTQYPFYLLADSREGQVKEAEVTRRVARTQPTYGRIRHGFVYERVPHVTLGSIANNSEIDVIWEKAQRTLEPLRAQLNSAIKKAWQEWEIPREVGAVWPEAAKKAHAAWWEARIARQKEIDASIAAKAEFEYLYDKPYEDRSKVRVAGPFTVESLSPHRMLGVGADGEVVETLGEAAPAYAARQGFPQMILDNLRTAGVQQAHKEDRITFLSLVPWPGHYVCGEGRYEEGKAQRRAAVFIGPEFGTVQRADLVAAAREAGDAGFDVLISCAFNYEAHTTEFTKLGRIPVLKARMNADLHMADDLKNTGKGNLFVVFGEPDIELLNEKDGQLRVKVRGVDVFKPQTGEVVSSSPDEIACWFVDTDYNEESFFVRQAYFLGAADPYTSLKTTLKAEIDAEAWATLHSDTSRPFPKPKQRRIAVKVINHLGDEVMKVFKV